jgi:phage baseplate assembly protein W
MKPNSLEKFQQTSVGSKGRIIDYIAKINPTGELQKVADLQAILTSWNNILTTPLRTYSFDPEFGSELYKYVFDPADASTLQKIDDEIRYRLNSFDDRAVITDVKIEFLSNRKGFNVIVFVKYDKQQGQITSVITESLLFNA